MSTQNPLLLHAPIEPLDVTARALIHATATINLPVLALKELIENSIDAGATSISIQIDTTTGGLQKFTVADNGHGIVNWYEHLGILNNISLRGARHFSDESHRIFYGYRGTAMFAIANTVGGPGGNMTITTKREGSKFARLWLVGNFDVSRNDRCLYSWPHGTSVCVENMFKTTYPVRFRHLNSQASKLVSATVDLVMAYCSARPDITFRTCLASRAGRNKVIATDPKNKTLSSILRCFAIHPRSEWWESLNNEIHDYSVNLAINFSSRRAVHLVQSLCLNAKPVKDTCRFYQLLRKNILASGFGGYSWVIVMSTTLFESYNLIAWRRGEAVFSDEKLESALLSAIVRLFGKSRSMERSVQSSSGKEDKPGEISSIFSIKQATPKLLNTKLPVPESPNNSLHEEDTSAISTPDVLTRPSRLLGNSTANTTFEREPGRNFHPYTSHKLPNARVHGSLTAFPKYKMQKTCREIHRNFSLLDRDFRHHPSLDSPPLRSTARCPVSSKCIPSKSHLETENWDYFEETSIPVHAEHAMMTSQLITLRVNHVAVRGNSGLGIIRFFDAEKIRTEPGEHDVLLIHIRD